MLPPPPRSTLFPYTTLFRSVLMAAFEDANPCFLKEIFGACLVSGDVDEVAEQPVLILLDQAVEKIGVAALQAADRKSTRLNSSHRTISYAVFCLKKKTQYT